MLESLRQIFNVMNGDSSGIDRLTCGIFEHKDLKKVEIVTDIDHVDQSGHGHHHHDNQHGHVPVWQNFMFLWIIITSMRLVLYGIYCTYSFIEFRSFWKWILVVLEQLYRMEYVFWFYHLKVVLNNQDSPCIDQLQNHNITEFSSPFLPYWVIFTLMILLALDNLIIFISGPTNSQIMHYCLPFYAIRTLIEYFFIDNLAMVIASTNGLFLTCDIADNNGLNEISSYLHSAKNDNSSLTFQSFSQQQNYLLNNPQHCSSRLVNSFKKYLSFQAINILLCMVNIRVIPMINDSSGILNRVWKIERNTMRNLEKCRKMVKFGCGAVSLKANNRSIVVSSKGAESKKLISSKQYIEENYYLVKKYVADFWKLMVIYAKYLGIFAFPGLLLRVISAWNLFNYTTIYQKQFYYKRYTGNKIANKCVHSDISIWKLIDLIIPVWTVINFAHYVIGLSSRKMLDKIFIRIAPNSLPHNLSGATSFKKGEFREFYKFLAVTDVLKVSKVFQEKQQLSKSGRPISVNSQPADLQPLLERHTSSSSSKVKKRGSSDQSNNPLRNRNINTKNLDIPSVENMKKSIANKKTTPHTKTAVKKEYRSEAIRDFGRRDAKTTEEIIQQNQLQEELEKGKKGRFSTVVVSRMKQNQRQEAEILLEKLEKEEISQFQSGIRTVGNKKWLKLSLMNKAGKLDGLKKSNKP